tara:strand:- start:138 stop:596 length:459 start_codon:yes stop_codon:yes gene_type:complete
MVVVVIVIFIILLYLWKIYFKKIEINPIIKDSKLFGEKDKLDPIMDPVYNIKEVCKNSVLLEEHMAQKQKRCFDCISKHFLLITGYIEEAIQLATNKVNNYPHLKESCKLYNALFKKWLEIKKKEDNEADILDIVDSLRKQRKILVSTYINN